MTSLRAIFGLFLGLVIQLSLVLPLLSAGAASHCEAAGCCEELSSCPCASNGESEQKPSPMAPAAVDLKLSIPKARELELQFLSVPPKTSGAATTALGIPESHVGFAGVPLSVAFCSFVI